MKHHSGRIDLKEKKEALMSSLGDKGGQYWSIFKDFIQAKISKTEFDQGAMRVLEDNNNGMIIFYFGFCSHFLVTVKLHNQFVLAVLKNARCPHPPPEYSKIIGRKRVRPDSVSDQPPAKRGKFFMNNLSLLTSLQLREGEELLQNLQLILLFEERYVFFMR